MNNRMEPSVSVFQPIPIDRSACFRQLSSDVEQLQSDLQQTLLDYAQLKLRACAGFTKDVAVRLADDDGAGARLSFQSAENAFESVQRCAARLERDDWRRQTEATLEQVGTTLDALWVRMISSGYPVL